MGIVLIINENIWNLKFAETSSFDLKKMLEGMKDALAECAVCITAFSGEYTCVIATFLHAAISSGPELTYRPPAHTLYRSASGRDEIDKYTNIHSIQDIQQ